MLGVDALDAAVEACRAVAIEPVVIEDESLGQHFAAGRFPLYLIRPDEHVAARLAARDLARLPSALALATGRDPSPKARLQESAMATPTEEIYEALSKAIDSAEAEGDRLALERIALSLAHAIGDPAAARRIIKKAAVPD
jgi:3-(3-hydroxy-phenyl)propionate hydroxylase